MAAVYRFTDDCEDKMLLGNKGANLVTMTRIGLRVPPGFVVSIEAYADYRRTGRLPIDDIEEGLHWLEETTGKRMGDRLMVSVRSSAPVSMPGMMDTLLNIRSKQHMISAIKKIFGSWDNLRAVEYRRLNNIPRDIGTSAVVQAMVMGNTDDRSGTGVVFTRNASTGEPVLFGEYIGRAQGEDLVSGVRTFCPFRSCARPCPTSMPSWKAWRASWRGTFTTCRTWSSPSSPAPCISCRPGPAILLPPRRGLTACGMDIL